MIAESTLPPSALHTLLNAIPGNHVFLLPDAPTFTIIGATNSFLQTSYTTREQLIGKSLFEVFPDNAADDKATGVSNLRASLNHVIEYRATHQLADQRYDIVNPDTGAFECKVWTAFSEPVLNTDGVIQYIIHTTEDITGKVRLREESAAKEERLQESEAKYRSLFESMNQGYCTLEMIFEGDRCVDYLYLETNPAFERHLGLSGAEGKTIREIAPDIEPKWFDFYGGVALTGNPIRIEEESKAFNKWFEVYAIRVGNPEERKVGVYFNDITERKTTERELQKNKELLQKVYDSAPNSIAVMQTLFDKEGQVEDFAILMLNAFTRHVVGPIDYVGKRYGEVFPTVKETGILDQFKAVATTGETACFERQYIGEGMNHWFRFTVVKHEELLVVTTEDITEHKTVLQKTEEIVAQRTQELAQANQSLLKINEELARSNTNLEEFAHAASHDMKEPIRKVLTFSDRLMVSLGDRLTETERVLFERVNSATQRMGLLVDDLLEFSHVSEKPLEKEEVNLNVKVKKVLTDLELLVEEKKAQIQVGALPTVKGYRRQLQQLFQNLIGNALKYNKPDQPPMVTITSQNVFGYEVSDNVLPDQPGQRFHLIEVKDNGIGFEPEYAEKIFQMFQRLHGKAEYPGTGVGLSIARKVVENHKGYIWAVSQPGEGATFKVLLPIE